MPKKPSREEFEAAQEVAQKVHEEIKREEKERPAEPLVQEFPFDSAFENKWEIEKLQKENAGLRKMIEELKEYYGGKIKRVEEELKNLRKLIGEKNPK